MNKCFDIIKKEDYIYPEAMILTRNNQACVYKRIGRYKKALNFLQRAQEILKKNQDLYSGLTYLNLCSLYSVLADHNKSLDYAKLAINNCQQELFWINSQNSLDKNNKEKQKLQRKQNEKTELLAIAYYNMAREQEILDYWEGA